MKCEKSEKLQEAVTSAVGMTFMNMAFVDVMPAEDVGELEYSHILHITFSSPLNGGMLLFLPTECKKTIVENVHGSNWESLTTDEIDDCLLELLNVLAGNFLNLYCGNDVGHNMSFPQILFDESEIPEKGNFQEFFYDAEGAFFKVGVCVLPENR